MNTPVRRVALAVMGMIVLLMANLTYVQVVKAGDYRDDPRNQRVLLAEYSRQRGQISAAGQVLAQSVETGDRLRFQREYPDGPVYSTVTGFYSVLYSGSGIERSMDEVLNGNDDRLFARRLSDLITGRDPSGGSVVLTIDPAVQQAAYEALTSRDYAGAAVALRPQTGRSGDGLHADLRPEQAGQPQLGRPDGGVTKFNARTHRCCRTGRSPRPTLPDRRSSWSTPRRRCRTATPRTAS